MCANVGGDQDQQNAEQERQPPAPADQLGVRQRGPQNQNYPRAKQRANEPARLCPAAHRSATILGGMLDEQGRYPAELAAERESLQQAQDDQKGWRRGANALITGEKAYQQSRNTHHR